MKYQPNYEITLRASSDVMRILLEMTTTKEQAKQYESLTNEEIIKIYIKRFVNASEVVKIEKIQ